MIVQFNAQNAIGRFSVQYVIRRRKISGYLTPKFSCKHATTIAAKPHPKSACQLQRSLYGRSRYRGAPFRVGWSAVDQYEEDGDTVEQ